MKPRIIRFKSPKIALKELQPYISDGKYIQTGKPFKRFDGLRPRELIANWLICATANFVHGSDRFTFTSDPFGGDGIIHDTATDQTWPTEHVLVPRAPKGETSDIEALILKAIKSKQEKGGAAYANGKTLVVFLNAVGAWHPTRIGKQLPEPLHFDSVWVTALQGVENGDYIYTASQLDLSQGHVPAWRVRIRKDFDSWEVATVQ